MGTINQTTTKTISSPSHWMGTISQEQQYSSRWRDKQQRQLKITQQQLLIASEGQLHRYITLRLVTALERTTLLPSTGAGISTSGRGEGIMAPRPGNVSFPAATRLGRHKFTLSLTTPQRASEEPTSIYLFHGSRYRPGKDNNKQNLDTHGRQTLAASTGAE